MGKIDAYLLREAWGVLKSQLHENGFCLRRGDSFECLESLIRGSQKPALTEHFRTDANTYFPDQAFWIAVETFSGELVARVATRVDDLGSQSLLEYWRRYWKRCYPGATGGRAEIAENQPRFAAEIHGRIAYLGDLYVESKFRNKGVATALVKVAQIDAADEWNPDYVYGWMTPADVGSNLFPAYGFTSVHSAGIRWSVPPGTISDNLVFVGNSRSSLIDLIEDITISRPV